MRLHVIARGLASATLLVAVIAGVPALLAHIGAAPTTVPSLEQVRGALLVQDQSMRVVFAVLAAVVWACWAAFTFSTLREVAAAIRSRGQAGARPLPRLDWAGRPAAHLVAAVVLLFVSTPALITATAPAAAAAVVTAGPRQTAPATATQPAPAETQMDTARDALRHRKDHGPTYTVQRRDTLWSIAETHLNDPMRWPELARLNAAVVGPSPDFLIRAGDRLTLPADATHPAARAHGEVVVVEAGDTLSQIAADHGVSDWRALWPANQGRPQPGGARLSDPDHIEPGWTVAMPRQEPGAPAGTATQETGATDADPARDGDQAANAAAGHARRDDLPERKNRDGPGASAQGGPAPGPAHAPAGASSEQAPTGIGLAGVFAGAGTLLAAGLFGALAMQRRRQFRFRRPGRTIGSTPAALVPLEKAVLAHGGPAMVDAGLLDRALRALAAATKTDATATLPDVVAVRMNGQQLDLRLDCPHPSAPPAPWTVDETGRWWSLDLTAEVDLGRYEARDHLAPWPALTAVGYGPSGDRWLLDLERAGAIGLTGNPDRCLDFGRFLAAALAVNAWSDHLSVTLVGFGQELVGINPQRLHHSQDLGAAAAALTLDAVNAVDVARAGGADARAGRLRDIGADTWMPHVLLVAPDLVGECGKLDDLLDIVRSHPGQTAIAVILAGRDGLAKPPAWQLELTDDGRLLIPALGLDLTAGQLPVAEGHGIAALLAQAAVAPDEPMPAVAGDQPWQAYCDAAGALRADLCLPRTTASHGPTLVEPAPVAVAVAQEFRSLLPLPDQTYLGLAATTTHDLAALAPRVEQDVHRKLEDADPTLDEDLAVWSDPDCALPRLTLLGPVQLRAHGEPPPKRLPYYTEIVAYLATRTNGATADQFGAAFNLQAPRARTDINIARAWLGVNPRTGDRHLPDAMRSPGAKARGIGVYQVRGVLVDYDLFRRLRVRGQARGDDGIEDLVAALSVVTGEPFDQQRRGGYEWLVEADRLDQHMVCAVVDVAHIVATHYLGVGDVRRAQDATGVALLAAPYEEIPRLDLAAIREAEGHFGEAEDCLRSQVCNRSDDGQAPTELPDRTEEVLHRRDWLTKVG